MSPRLRGRIITDPKERKFYGSCYSTLSFSALLILSVFAYYLYRYHDLYEEHSFHMTASIVVLIALGLCMAAGFLKTDRLDFFAFDFTFPFWSEFLPIVTLFFILAVISVCWLSGGAQVSPFTQFLLPIGTLAMVFARKLTNRVYIVLLTGAGFWFVLYDFVEPKDTRPPGIEELHLVCGIIALAVGAVAASKVPDWQQTPPAEGTHHSTQVGSSDPNEP